MIARVIALSIRRREWVLAGAALLAILGLFAAWRTPVDAIPDLSETQVIVYAEWPGRDPQALHERVAAPLSRAITGAPGVRTIRSSSDHGAAWVHVIFDETQAIDAARRSVMSRLDDARPSLRLPAGVVPRLAPDAPATGQIYWYTVDGGGLDLGELRELQDRTIKPELQRVTGVAEVASVGGVTVECQVAIDPARLLARGVTWRELFDALDERLDRNAVLRGGDIAARDVGDPLQHVERLTVSSSSAAPVRLVDVADVRWAPGPRQGILEMDGSEAVGGVVTMRYGENPAAVVARVRQAIELLSERLPEGVRIVTGYDRTPLVRDAIGTVLRALAEAIVTAILLVVLVMRHWRASLVIAISLPLAVLCAFLGLAMLRLAGIADIPTNIMSLAGIVISIGVLVDASIVMTENVLHQLRNRFGEVPVTGDVRDTVERACQAVGRPIFFSVLIMLLSFLPVFALSGLEGKMFRPLAVTKSLVLLAVAGLAVTFVPALASYLVRGRLQAEHENRLVRSLIDAYRPLLSWLLDHPVAIYWWVGITLVVGAAPLGGTPRWLADMLAPLGPLAARPLVLVAFVGSFLAVGLAARSLLSRTLLLASLVLVTLVADRAIEPLAGEFLTPLDERTVMDMPISVPRMTAAQAIDDLKTRDMLLCRFPEVDMVMGKVGRADTPTDPAPIEMIETMVSFRPEEIWPRRRLDARFAERLARQLADALAERSLVKSSQRDDGAWRESLDAILFRFDAMLREYCYQRYEERRREVRVAQAPVGSLVPAPHVSGATLRSEPLTYGADWRRFARQVDRELAARAPGVFVRLTLERLLAELQVTDETLRGELRELMAFRVRAARTTKSAAAHHGGPSLASDYEPLAVLDGLQAEFTERFASHVRLARCRRDELIGFGGELDRTLQMPGWANVWTMPIQNRVDMLATGVNTTIGVRVLGDDLQKTWETSERLAELLRELPGAQDVVADPILGKGALVAEVDPVRTEEVGLPAAEVEQVARLARGGALVGSIGPDASRRSVRVTLVPSFLVDAESLGRLPLPIKRGVDERPLATTLDQVAELKFREGPAAIKGENGRLRNYVRLNVRDRDASTFVAEARQLAAERLELPAGVTLEWTGQFEHQERARRSLLFVLPIVLALIAGILYWTYRDAADALLMLLAVPGAAAGGLFFQWLFGFKFSVNVWIGYIACFGMATSTGIVMLVYLREALESAGGLGRVTVAELRETVLRGATQRLRPKLLTEGTTLLSLAPMLFAAGVGAEVIRPMAAPVLGGILVADEIIDLFLPVMFYAVRLRRWRRLHGESHSSTDERRRPKETTRLEGSSG